MVDHVWEVVGELEGEDAARAAAKEDALAETEGLDDGADVARLLGWIQFLVDFHFARGHLATVKGRAGVSVRQGRHDGEELAAVAVTAWDKDD